MLVESHEPLEQNARDTYYVCDRAVHERKVGTGKRTENRSAGIPCNSARTPPVPAYYAIRLCAGR